MNQASSTTNSLFASKTSPLRNIDKPTTNENKTSSSIFGNKENFGDNKENNIFLSFSMGRGKDKSNPDKKVEFLEKIINQYLKMKKQKIHYFQIKILLIKKIIKRNHHYLEFFKKVHRYLETIIINIEICLMTLKQLQYCLGILIKGIQYFQVLVQLKKP